MHDALEGVSLAGDGPHTCKQPRFWGKKLNVNVCGLLRVAKMVLNSRVLNKNFTRASD